MKSQGVLVSLENHLSKQTVSWLEPPTIQPKQSKISLQGIAGVEVWGNGIGLGSSSVTGSSTGGGSSEVSCTKLFFPYLNETLSLSHHFSCGNVSSKVTLFKMIHVRRYTVNTTTNSEHTLGKIKSNTTKYLLSFAWDSKYTKEKDGSLIIQQNREPE